jgi:tRNA-Thr(GGU) m(6)t(6)A37 methyltransferase TsaA
MQSVTFRVIGQVESANDGGVTTQAIQEEVLIILQPTFSVGLDGVMPGDRLVVIFVFDRARDCALRQHPRGDQHRALRGVFALRSPGRPNPIGVSSVEVLEIVENVVRVRGLDTCPSTPILDLKPEVKGDR